jgi:glycopeptide antibiotics resistance protein
MGLDFDLMAWVVGIGLLMMTLTVLRARGHHVPFLFFLSIFWIYLLLVLKVAVFPIPLARGMSEDTAQELLPRMLSSMNLRLFFFGYYATLESISVTVLQNLVLTVPFGFGINFIRPLKIKEILWLSVAVGFGIEIIQLMISLWGVYLGMWSPDHIVDINDALLNMLGIWLGYGLFRLFAVWYASFGHRHGRSALLEYIQQVTSRL